VVEKPQALALVPQSVLQWALRSVQRWALQLVQRWALQSVQRWALRWALSSETQLGPQKETQSGLESVSYNLVELYHGTNCYQTRSHASSHLMLRFWLRLISLH